MVNFVYIIANYFKDILSEGTINLLANLYYSNSPPVEFNSFRKETMMYFLVLFFSAFLLISFFATNWPFKLYHFYLLKSLAQAYGIKPIRFGLLLSSVFSELKIEVNLKSIRVRFLESSIDSLNKTNSGWELRQLYPAPTILEFYHVRLAKREWGDFKRFITGNVNIDSEWVILTPDLIQAQKFWQIKQQSLEQLLNNQLIEQILFSSEEIIIRLRRFVSVTNIQTVVELLLKLN